MSEREVQLSEIFPGKEFLIVGAGKTGEALQRFLISRGLRVHIIDERAEGAQRSIPESIESEKVIAIVSPGWRMDHPWIEELRKKQVETISEIDFAWRIKCQIAPDQIWIAVTGTNGKTTTIQMVESIFHAAKYNGVACGNVGRTVIETVAEGYDVLAIEISSFQLEWSHEARFAAAAILNIAPDHIDWHGSFESYRQAKIKLAALSDLILVNASDATISKSLLEISKRSLGNTKVELSNQAMVTFHLDTPAAGELGLVENLLVDRRFVIDPSEASELADVERLPSKAPHNLLNSLAAAGLARSLGIACGDIESGLASFQIDHHRMEKILDQDGITWINDSKATNPHAALSALLSCEKVIWIAGGLAKGAAMDELARAAHRRIDAAILIGTDASLIRDALIEQKPSLKVIECDNSLRGEELMTQVVTYAKNLASKGQTVLLAPACASMDQFSSYAERGELFSKKVKELVAS